VGSGDVEEDEFISTGLVIDLGLLHGVARVAQVDEIDTFDNTAVFNI
jgi:hypothetical protein